MWRAFGPACWREIDVRGVAVGLLFTSWNALERSEEYGRLASTRRGDGISVSQARVGTMTSREVIVLSTSSLMST